MIKGINIKGFTGLVKTIEQQVDDGEYNKPYLYTEMDIIVRAGALKFKPNELVTEYDGDKYYFKSLTQDGANTIVTLTSKEMTD